jgi:hypothetical protein
MMDEATKQVFKAKFAVLAVILNVIILCFAMAIFVFLRFAPSSTIGLGIGIFLAVTGAALSLLFRKRYYSTKAWLHEQP